MLLWRLLGPSTKTGWGPLLEAEQSHCLRAKFHLNYQGNFRPCVFQKIPPNARSKKKPIILGRHLYPPLLWRFGGPVASPSPGYVWAIRPLYCQKNPTIRYTLLLLFCLTIPLLSTASPPSKFLTRIVQRSFLGRMAPYVRASTTSANCKASRHSPATQTSLSTYYHRPSSLQRP